MGNSGKLIIFTFVLHFLDFALYGSWEALDSVKILSRGAPTISTPGKPNYEIFVLDFFDVSNPIFKSELSTR